MFMLSGILIGLVAGFLGGQFGVGGGLITTPAIRLILQQSALVAVGTPLPIIIPTALSGFYNYHKNKLVDYQTGLIIGLTGAFASVFGALLVKIVGGGSILLITALLIALVSIRYFKPEKSSGTVLDENRPHRGPHSGTPVLIGLVAGFASGFLGLGGGFIIIPALTVLMGVNIKKAFGTSLLAIIFIAIPGSITHYIIGNINISIAIFITLGVIPGAYLGSRTTIALPENVVRILFGLYLLINAILLFLNELFL